MKLWLNERMKILKDDLHALSLQTHQNKMQKIEMKGRNRILKIELNCWILNRIENEDLSKLECYRSNYVRVCEHRGPMRYKLLLAQ